MGAGTGASIENDVYVSRCGVGACVDLAWYQGVLVSVANREGGGRKKALPAGLMCALVEAFFFCILLAGSLVRARV